MEKINKDGLNIVDANIQKMKALFPECVVEGKINFDVLKNLLGDYIEKNNESYSFIWNGKSAALKYSQTPSVSTLLPKKQKSLNWEKTQNIYIEGDNLEVLKTLSKTYHNAIKMIYIDPPYNTGKDFVYHDNFHNDIDNYLVESNQAYKSNPETSGRYHTDWLNMMYPRLKLAYELLKDDGVIFISINEVELLNLSKICDSIFGEECLIARFIWENTANPNATANNVGVTHEYILSYSKNPNTSLKLLPLSNDDLESYKGRDEFIHERGPFKLVGLNKTGTVTDLRPNLQYDISAPDGSIIKPNPRWRWSKEKFEKGLEENRIVFNKTSSGYSVSYKQYLYEDTEGNKIERGNLIKTIFNDCGRTTNGTLEVSEILGKGIFDFPKPISLIKKLLTICVNENDIVMDFFSGSATTAQAVYEYNVSNETNVKFILVQLPEAIDADSEAYSKGFTTICDVGEERIRRCAGKLTNEIEKKKSEAGLFAEEEKTPSFYDLGFKVFTLDSTNIQPWDPTVKYDDNSIFRLNEIVKKDRTNLDVAYEVMLKYGVFNMPLEEIICNGKTIYSVGSNYMIISLNDEITEADVAAIAKLQPNAVVFKESGFADDNAKMNADYTFKRLGIDNVKCI